MKTETNNAQHTPGPIIVTNSGPFMWSLTRLTTAEEKRQMGLQPHDTRHMSLLCVDKDGFACVKKEGDARLWAAAPELLAALKKVERLCYDLMKRAEAIDRRLIALDGRKPDCELGEIQRLREFLINEARAAIAKAKGGAS